MRKESGKTEEGEIEDEEEGKRMIFSAKNKHFIQLSEMV